MGRYGGFPLGGSGGGGTPATPTIEYPERQSGQWYFFPYQQVAATNQVGNGTLRVCPQYLTAGTFVSVNIGISVAGNAGATFRPTIYSNAAGDIPGALLHDMGLIGAATTSPTALTGTWAIPSDGLYWVGGVVQDATPTQPTVYTCAGGANGMFPVPATWGGTAPSAAAGPSVAYSMSGLTTGAAPSTFTIAGVAGFTPRLMLKTA